MATTIGKLNLKLAVNPEALVAGLDAASKKVKTFVGSAIVQFTRMVNVGGMIEDVFNRTFGSILDASSVFSKIDEMAKFADNVGISTEALAGFELAADLSGVAIQGLRKALEENQKVMGEAQVNGQKVALTFERFGLSAQALGQMNMEDRIGAIADAYLRLDDPVQRAALAVKAFGGEGQKFQKFLENGAAGLRAIRREAEHFGLTFSRIDAAGIERARDAVTRLQVVFEGIKRQAAIQLAPIISLMAEKLVEFLKNGPGVAVIVKKIADTILGVVDALLGAVEQIVRVLGNMEGAGNRVEGVFSRLVSHPRNLFQDDPALGGGGGADAAAGITGLRARIRQLIDSTAVPDIPVPKAWSGLLKEMGDIADQLELKTGQFGKTAEQLQLAAFKARGQDIEAKVAAGAAELATTQEAVDAMTERLAQMQARGVRLRDAAAQALINPHEAKAQQQATLRMAERLEMMTARLADAKGPADALARFRTETERIGDAMKEIAENKLFEDLKARAAGLEASLLTPFDHLRAKIIDIQKMLGAGLLSPKAAAQLEMMAGIDAAKAFGGGEAARLAAGLREGSAEAISAVNRAAAQVNPNKAVEDLLGKVRAQIEAGDRRQVELLAAIAGALGGGDVLPP